jgi:hypothetical protein
LHDIKYHEHQKAHVNLSFHIDVGGQGKQSVLVIKKEMRYVVCRFENEVGMNCFRNCQLGEHVGNVLLTTLNSTFTSFKSILIVIVIKIFDNNFFQYSIIIALEV